MASEYTNVDLRHTIGTSTAASAIMIQATTHYSLTPIRVRRPTRGSKIVMVRCTGCEALVRTRIHSARYTLWIRCWWLLMTLATAGGLAVLIVVTDSLSMSSGPLAGASDGVAIAFLITLIVLFSVVFKGIILYYNEDGVRLGWRHWLRGHRLKRGLAANEKKR